MSSGPTTGPGVIDLNADLGESFGAWRLGDDDALLGVVTSSGSACRKRRKRSRSAAVAANQESSARAPELSMRSIV